MSTTVNRGWLKKQINDGKMLVRSSFQLTDDYGFDESNNFGIKDEWVNATEYKFADWDFKTKSGGAYKSKDKQGNDIISFYIHSNSSYELKPI